MHRALGGREYSDCNVETARHGEPFHDAPLREIHAGIKQAHAGAAAYPRTAQTGPVAPRRRTVGRKLRRLCTRSGCNQHYLRLPMNMTMPNTAAAPAA